LYYLYFATILILVHGISILIKKKLFLTRKKALSLFNR
jgi:hypothetical protein